MAYAFIFITIFGFVTFTISRSTIKEDIVIKKFIKN